MRRDWSQNLCGGAKPSPLTMPGFLHFMLSYSPLCAIFRSSTGLQKRHVVIGCLQKANPASALLLLFFFFTHMQPVVFLLLSCHRFFSFDFPSHHCKRLVLCASSDLVACLGCGWLFCLWELRRLCCDSISWRPTTRAEWTFFVFFFRSASMVCKQQPCLVSVLRLNFTAPPPKRKQCGRAGESLVNLSYQLLILRRQIYGLKNFFFWTTAY